MILTQLLKYKFLLNRYSIKPNDDRFVKLMKTEW